MTDIPHHRLPVLPGEWDIQILLPCASICGFTTVPRVDTGLLRSENVSLLELYLYLRGSNHPATLRAIIRTDYERQSVTNAYIQFCHSLSSSKRAGRAPSDRLEWIVPDEYLDPLSRVCPHRLADLSMAIERSFTRPLNLESGVLEWLPWMSLGIVSRLRNWRAPRINALRRAIFKLAEAFDGDADAFYPWEANFSASYLPIQVLYQHDPSSLMRDSLHQLAHLGLTSVHDLRCLHPDAVAAAQEKKDPLMALYNVLRQPTRPIRRAAAKIRSALSWTRATRSDG